MVSPMVASSGTENTFGLMIRPAVSSGYWSRSSTSDASRVRIPRSTRSRSSSGSSLRNSAASSGSSSWRSWEISAGSSRGIRSAARSTPNSPSAAAARFRSRWKTTRNVFSR